MSWTQAVLAGKVQIMTINTTFTVGATLTAAQQNNFPRGLAADIKKSETTDTYTGTEKAVQGIYPIFSTHIAM